VIRRIVVEGTSERWHALLYLIIAIALVLLVYETVATQTLTGSGIEFTIGSGSAYLVNQTNAPIRAAVKSQAPFIVESEDKSIRFDVTSKTQEYQEFYTREIELPLGEYSFRLALGSNVTFSLSREAEASVTVTPYNNDHSTIMLVVTALSVLGSLYSAFRALRASTPNPRPVTQAVAGFEESRTEVLHCLDANTQT
jgi:hypothetical protein